MESRLEAIIAETRHALGEVTRRADLETVKSRIVGPRGSLTEVTKEIPKLSKEERPAAGKLINQAKQEVEKLFAEADTRMEQQEALARLGPPIDPTLPPPERPRGLRHPLTQVREEICGIFRRAGFVIEEGPEVDTDFYCFDALNFLPDHPARDMQDTYFFPSSARFANVSQKAKEPYLLRTHTSTVQIRTMLAKKPPLRFVAPGRCFRRDTADATHSANFHQVEGLYVDRNVTVQDLKAILDYFARNLFGSSVETRLRPSYFPFTEPSFEMDVRSPDLGRLSNRWLEIMGCGVVDPAVFAAVEYDPEEWTGYAFGMGIERIAMLLYRIDDIRHFYQNDLRFLAQFA